MNLFLSRGGWLDLAVTTKKQLGQIPQGARIEVTLQDFVIRHEGGKTAQVYTGLKFPMFHMPINPEEMEDYFDDIKIIENQK